MSIPFVTFRPAQYYKGNDSFVYFYATDPLTGKLKRKRIKLNHIKRKTERDRYAQFLCHQLNEKLYEGWNPFVEQLGSKAVTITSAIDQFLADRAKSTRKATIDSYSSFSGFFKEWLSLAKLSGNFVFTLDHKHLRSYMDYIDNRSSISNRTYNNHISFLVLLFDFFIERDFIKENPAKKLKKRKVDSKKRGIIPPSVRSEIKEYLQKNNPCFYQVVLLCYRCLIRPKEITMLKLRYYDPVDGMLTIPSDVAKNHHERVIALPDELRDYFDRILHIPSDWYLFSNSRTFEPGPKRLAHTRISGYWAMMREELKLPDSYQFYSLKDTGITEMLEAGVPPKFVKELADHHSLEMTERYTHKSDAKKILEYNKLEF